MKHLLLLIATIFTLQVSAQTPMEKAEALRNKYASITGSSWNKIISRSTPTHKLDSIVSRTEDGSFLELLEISYNADGTTSFMEQYEADSATGERVLISTMQFLYNGSGNPSSIVINFANEETGELDQQLIFDITYTNDGRTDSLVISQEDPFGGGFTELLAFKYIYDGDLIDETRDYFNFSFLGSWLQTGGTDYIYNSEDQLVEEVSSILDFESLQIILDSRTVYSYNANNLLDTATVYLYSNDEWVLDHRTIYEYFATGRIKNAIEQVYVNNEWVNNLWTRYYQATVTDEEDITTSLWDVNANVWVTSDSTHEVLNPSLLWEDVYAPTQLGFIQTDEFFFNFLNDDAATLVESHYVIFNDVTGEPEIVNINTNYYSLFDPSKIETVLPDFISVAPNPATEYFNISLRHETTANYVITSLNGQRMDAGMLSYGITTVETNGYAPGVYMVLITMADGKTYAHKQVIK